MLDWVDFGKDERFFTHQIKVELVPDILKLFRLLESLCKIYL